ncbi:MAG: ABC transporter substrate-binding protein [Alphaproteobacteria bacterium]|nr:MAG: ABC transporter substrate-binding protein [Alphaproteobacteria bacterium]
MLLGALFAVAVAASPAIAQGNLRIGLAEDPDNLDPTTAGSYVGRIVLAAMCDKLFDIDAKLNIVPQLALSHETSADGKTVTIKLRPNVKFHDGEPFNAEAVKFTLDRHMTKDDSKRKAELSQIDKVEIADPLTVRLALKAPFSPLIAQLTDRAGMMVSPKAVKEGGDKFVNKPICAGPFRFADRVAQDRIVLDRFADYWDKERIHVERITYRPIPDSTVRLANLRAGALDIIERVLATDIPAVRADPKLKLVVGPSLMYTGLTINLANTDKAKNPLGQNAKVREALELSIDRDAINKVVFNGEFTPGNQFSAPTNPYYVQKFPIPPRNVEKAKALIKEAGVTTPVTLDLMVPNQPDVKQVAEVLQAMGAEAGFDLKIRLTEFATSLDEAVKGNFQIYLIGWSGRLDPDQNVINHIGCNTPFNWGKYCNETTQAALNEARLYTDIARRKAAYEKAFAQIQADRPLIYLYHQALIFAHSAKLQGYMQPPDGIIRPQDIKLAP